MNNLPATNNKIESRTVTVEFSEPQLDIIHSIAQFNLMHCGVGSGKTYVIGCRNFLLAKHFPHVRGFIGANTYNQLSKSTLVGVFKFWGMIGLKKDIHYVVNTKPPAHFKIYGEPLENYRNTISFENGKLIFLASLDNYKMIDGMEFAHADLDETKDSKEEAIQEVISPRLRQKGMWIDKHGNIIGDEELAILQGLEGYNPLSIYTSPAKTDWLSDMFNLPLYYDEITSCIFDAGCYFRKRTEDKLIVIASTYFNEHNLPKGYIENKLIGPNKHNKHRVDMLVFGSPIGKVGNEYYTQFDRYKIVKEVAVPPSLVSHFSFDFNVVPYITLGGYKIWYKKDVQRWHVHKWTEICSPPPEHTCEHLCNKAITLHDHELKWGLFIYGDKSGKNRRTNSVEHDFDVIFRVLWKYCGDRLGSDKSLSDRVINTIAPKTRKDFMNKIFFGSLPIDFTISPKCVNTIKDCEFLQEAPDGGKIKPKDKNGAEKYGHCSDEMEYFFTSAFNEYLKL